MNQIRTCVITVNYKGAEDTAACVESLKNSSVPVSIVVVDNTPDDPDLVRALSPYADIHLIRSPENLGFGGGNNLGINWALEHTNCEFIFILNNDAEVLPNTISVLMKVLDEKPECGMSTGRIVFKENPDVLWYGGGEISWRRGGAIIRGIMGKADAPLALTSREVNFASGCAMLIRRSAMLKVGGFDTVFFMYEEDVDLCLRISKTHKIYYESSALILHQGQGSQRKGGDKFRGKWSASNPNYAFHVYHMTRNTLINVRKHALLIDKIIWGTNYPVFLLIKTLKAFRGLGLAAFIPVIKGLVSGLLQKRSDWRD